VVRQFKHIQLLQRRVQPHEGRDEEEKEVRGGDVERNCVAGLDEDFGGVLVPSNVVADVHVEGGGRFEREVEEGSKGGHRTREGVLDVPLDLIVAELLRPGVVAAAEEGGWALVWGGLDLIFCPHSHLQSLCSDSEDRMEYERHDTLERGGQDVKYFLR
jgi:hypothetical protein